MSVMPGTFYLNRAEKHAKKKPRHQTRGFLNGKGK